MINEITGLKSDEEKFYLPRLIWWPLKPQMQNLELVNFCPGMLRKIAIASIFCDYPGIFSKFCESPDLKVDKCLKRGAEQSHNPVYLKLIEDCVAEKGLDTSFGYFAINGDWEALEEDLEPLFHAALVATE